MGEILFLSHRIPFPPDRGDKIRSHHLLKALAQIAPVHVGTFGETPQDMAAESDLAQLAKSHRLVLRCKPLMLAGAEAVIGGKPVSLTAFANSALHDWVATTLAAHPVSTIVVFSGQMGQYVPADFAGRVIIDLCDVDSAKFDAYAEQGRIPRKLIDRREGRLLAAVEAQLVARAETVLLVSQAEADVFRSRLPAGAPDNIRALRNGIDAQFFDPAEVKAESPFADQPGPHLVFTGQMDYQPNVAAVERVVAKILPAIRREFPSVQFHIVGRAPNSRVLRLNSASGVKVWGTVPDVRPFLRYADAVLAPLAIARGIQNKVLEAMAMARPVVLSPPAATGIDAQRGIDFAVGESDSALAAQAIELLAKPASAAAMGAAARDYVIAHQSWDAMLAPLAGMFGVQHKEALRHVA